MVTTTLKFYQLSTSSIDPFSIIAIFKYENQKYPKKVLSLGPTGQICMNTYTDSLYNVVTKY